jgi:lycopene cyclase domain-containing protein
VGDYTLAAVLAPAAVIAVELAVLRTGLLRRGRFWAAVAVAMAFQIPVDGWLTHRGAPIVMYDPQAISGIRGPWNIPVEDFGFGFALVALTLLLWQRTSDPHAPAVPPDAGSTAGGAYTPASGPG